MVNKIQSKSIHRSEGFFNEDSYSKIAFKVIKTAFKVITIVPLIFELAKYAYNSMRAKKEAKNQPHFILSKIMPPQVTPQSDKKSAVKSQNGLVKLFKENKNSILVISALCTAVLTLKYSSNISFPNFELEKLFSKKSTIEFILEKLPSKEVLYYLTIGGMAIGSATYKLPSFMRPSAKDISYLDTSNNTTDDLAPADIGSDGPFDIASLRQDRTALTVKQDPTKVFSDSSLFTVYLSEHNQTSECIAKGEKNIQSCASNALVFLNLALENRENLNTINPLNFGKLIEDSLKAGYIEDDNLRRKYQMSTKNRGATIEELADLHRENTSLREIDFDSSFVNQDIASDKTPSLELEVKAKENMDYSPLLSIKPNPNYNGDIGFIIFKGGQSFSLYKHGDYFYFYNSHGTIEAESNKGAYVVKSKNINNLLRSFDYFSDPMNGEPKHSVVQFYTVLPKNN